MSTRVVFAANSGISSALALVRRFMAESPRDRVWIFYAHRAGDHQDELEQLLALKDRYLDRVALGVITERESDEAELLSGTLDGAKIRSLSSRLFDPHAVERYFVFGPDSLAAEVTAALDGLGVERTRVEVERAHHAISCPTADAPVGREETQVSFVMDGRRRAFSLHTGEESILDGAARAGIELPFSCKAGVCATCRTKLVRGEVEMAQNYALEDWELEQGFILACQSRAKTPEIELTYDET